MSVEYGSNITPLFGDREPPEPPARVRPRVKKRRLLAIFLPLGILAIVSTLFGMMMAVASDLPDLENRKEYQDARNSVLVDSQGQTLGRPDQQPEPRARALPGPLAVHDATRSSRSRTGASTRTRASTSAASAAPSCRTSSAARQRRAARRSPSSSSRTRCARSRTAPCSRRCARRRWPTTSRASGPKSKILTEYLNSIYFGNGAYGVESAARTYFGNQPDHQDCGTRANLCVKQLKPDEAALIAGVVANPTAYDPVAHPQAALARRNLVLKDMFDQGLLPLREYRDARIQALPAPIDIKPPTVRTQAPYFTTWIRQQLVDQFGARKAFEGGLKVHTTLDLDLQKAAEQAVNKYLPNPAGPSAAVVAIDNKTGEVRAMVGGRDYATRPFNLATQGQRQPGSSIKPFILASALKKGYGAGSLWPSRKRVFTVPGTRGKEKFVVNNFESKYAGTQTLAGGLTYSDNSVFSAVGISVGTKKIAALAERMGIRTPVSSNYAMTLGGLKQGVTPLDMAHAYETFIEGGRRIGGTLGASDDGPVGIEKVDSPNGKTLKQNHLTSKAVLDRGIANETVGIMTTVISQGTGRARRARPGPVRRRQDGDDREQRRRVVRRLHQALDRRRLGRLSRQAQADAHRVRRGPGRGRHLPGR